MWQIAAPLADIVTAAATVGILVVAYRAFGTDQHKEQREARKEQREALAKKARLDEVQAWSNNVIKAFHTIRLLCEPGILPLDDDTAKRMLARAIIDTSALVDQGRIFYKNSDHRVREGMPGALAGYRAKVLDPILVAHEAACTLATLGGDSADMRYRLCQIIWDRTRDFLSLVRPEIGRDMGVEYGEGLPLTYWLQHIDENRLQKFMSRSKTD